MSNQSPSSSPSRAAGTPIEVIDPASPEQDADSVFKDENVGNSTASVSSTILAYRKLHGRTYHNFEGVEYWGPNDAKQNEGLDLAHHMMYLALDDQLFLAPLENPQKVLDLATGTGIWAVDFADQFPSAEVVGTDISPIQPLWVPPNCRFELDNCERPWTYPDNSFDYIHIRGLVGCIQDWEALYKDCLRCLKPGGWFEQQEYSLPIVGNSEPLPDDSVWNAWGKVFEQAGEKTGRSFLVTDHWTEWLQNAGFTGRMNTSTVKLPIGGWPLQQRQKEVGLFNCLSLEQGLDGFASYICTQVLGWQPDELTVLLARVRAALKDQACHACYDFKTVYTQKPRL